MAGALLFVPPRLPTGTGTTVATKSGARPSASRAVGVSGDWGHGRGGFPVDWYALR